MSDITENQMSEHLRKHYGTELMMEFQNIGKRMEAAKGKEHRIKGDSITIPFFSPATKMSKKVLLSNTEREIKGMREVKLRSERFVKTLTIPREHIHDLGEIGTQQLSQHIQSIKTSMALTHDDVILDGILGTSYETADGVDTAFEFPVTNVTEVNRDLTGTSGGATRMTAEKIKYSKQMFRKRNVYGVGTANASVIPTLFLETDDLTSLYAEAQSLSVDYQRAMDLAFDNETKEFSRVYGVNLVVLPDGTLPIDGGVRETVMMHSSGLDWGKKEEYMLRVSENKDKNYDWDVHIQCNWGAVRSRPEAFQKILVNA